MMRMPIDSRDSRRRRASYPRKTRAAFFLAHQLLRRLDLSSQRHRPRPSTSHVWRGRVRGSRVGNVVGLLASWDFGVSAVLYQRLRPLGGAGFVGLHAHDRRGLAWWCRPSSRPWSWSACFSRPMSRAGIFQYLAQELSEWVSLSVLPLGLIDCIGLL